MLRVQQISVAGYDAIKRIQAKQAEGTDDPLPTARLWNSVETGTATPDQIYGAIGNGISGKTGSEMIKAVQSRARTQTNAVERGDYDTLKTALGGHALESGQMDIFGEGKQAAAQLWTQAQAEWNRRVVSGTEKPDDVLADMMPRYQKSVPDRPQAWPNPRYGMVQSTKDVADVAQKTRAAFEAGTLSQEQYNAEGELLTRYLTFYQHQDAAKAAADKVKPGARRSALPLAPADEGTQ